jgi:hypothetical protein
MKLNFAVIFTLILLSLMIGAGVVSAAVGYRLGREALKGITQPDTRPTSNMARRNTNTSGSQHLVILKEADILADVKARMEGKVTPEAEPQSDQPAATPESSDSSSNPTPKVMAILPLSSSDQGVTLEVRSTRRQGAMLVLDVALRNDGLQPVEFLYSFINVKDDQGQALSASTEGLPSELPPGSNTFSGEVRIPSALVGESEKLSLSLTDYPNQQLQLNLAGIPVVQ